MPCLFCGYREKNHENESQKDLVCGTCVQLMLMARECDLKGAYDKATAKGYAKKARAIESFLTEKGYSNDRKAKKFKRNMARKRPLRTIRPSRNRIRT